MPGKENHFPASSWNSNALSFTASFIEKVPKGSWVCGKTFTAEPFNVSPLRFQAHFKGHFK
jgi:hypothetical protein